MQDIKRLIFMVLPLLFVPLVYGLPSTPDACAADMHPGWGDPSRCTPVSGTLEGSECCWDVEVPEGTGKDGGNTEEYCQACYFGSGGTNLIYCDDPELQFRPIPTTNLPTLEQVPPTPLFGQNIPQDLQTLTETPPTPLPPPPTDPFTTPEDDQNVVDENGDKEDGTPTRPPLRDNLPELKEVPEDDRPEQDEEPSDEGKEDSTEGAETAGPLT